MPPLSILIKNCASASAWYESQWQQVESGTKIGYLPSVLERGTGIAARGEDTSSGLGEAFAEVKRDVVTGSSVLGCGMSSTGLFYFLERSVLHSLSSTV